MCTQRPTEELSWPSGTQHARCASGKGKSVLYATKVIPRSLAPKYQSCLVKNKTASSLHSNNFLGWKFHLVIKQICFNHTGLVVPSRRAFRGNFFILSKFHTFIRSVFVVVLVFAAGLNERGNCSSLVSFVFTVRSLYAGTLATSWTTAPRYSPSRSPTALLAAFCLFLATLTIAARCYASTYATHPVVQLSSHPPSLSPITADDSDSQTHSSKLVLRILSPRKAVQSDTRVIVINSKILLYNQRFKITNSTNFKGHARKKRDYETERNFLKQREHDKYLVSNQIPRVDSKPFSVKEGLKGTKIVVASEKDNSASARNNSANATQVSETLRVEHQNDPVFKLVSDETIGSSTKRPMPSAHDHENNTCKYFFRMNFPSILFKACRK